ncbi:MAG: tRNA pseudouridine(13) synthase TruD [Magnetococcales bacterium]|nr:tRNA pseudouridine(13) synthase TruD [Magnetococcales bacterium]
MTQEEGRRWPLASPGGGLGGRLRESLEDFRVEELRPEPLSGEGEHWILRIEKRGLTTDQAAQWLAAACGCRREGIGHAGLKDRQGVTVQDLSVHLPGKSLPSLAPPPGLTLLTVDRHHRKIRPGHLAGNRFVVRLRGVEGERGRGEEAAAWLLRHGVPNYFGEQRFGRDGDNAAQGRRLLSGERMPRLDRHQRGILLSAVRSELFNDVLAERIRRGWFTRLLPGDVAQLEGRSACFRVEDAGVEGERFQRGEIHPTGPLFGKGLMSPTGEPGALEEAVGGTAAQTLAQLADAGLEGARRALRILPKGFEMAWEGEDLLLRFDLPRGAYATTLLRELRESEPAAT